MLNWISRRDAANTGYGIRQASQGSLDQLCAPCPTPDYPPAQMEMKPDLEQQLWRLVNASGITYLNLAVYVRSQTATNPSALMAIDGVPLYGLGCHGAVGPFAKPILQCRRERGWNSLSRDHLPDESGLLVTRTVDTRPGGENDPNRALAINHCFKEEDAPKPTLKRALTFIHNAAPSPLHGWEASLPKARAGFTPSGLLEPNNPNSATEFYLTVDGQPPMQFDPKSSVPNIVVKQGTVEDWIIENHSSELHAFHIHQLHFMLLEYRGKPVNEPFLRDTINVPYYDNKALAFPSVTLRMDFRDPNTIGEFLYHCHLTGTRRR